VVGSAVPAEQSARGRRRTLLVIYESDSDAHVDAVRRLTRVLRSRCNFTDVVSEMTRRDAIRRSKADFVLDAFSGGVDVALVVVSDRLRAAWRASRRVDPRGTTAAAREPPSVGQLLLQQLRGAVALRRPGAVSLVVAARFDYTPARTDVDTHLAHVSDVYELMRDIYRLMLTLRGVNRCETETSLSFVHQFIIIIYSYRKGLHVGQASTNLL